MIVRYEIAIDLPDPLGRDVQLHKSADDLEHDLKKFVPWTRYLGIKVRLLPPEEGSE